MQQWPVREAALIATVNPGHRPDPSDLYWFFTPRGSIRQVYWPDTTSSMMKNIAFRHRLPFPPPLEILRALPRATESKMGVLSFNFADVVGLTTL